MEKDMIMNSLGGFLIKKAGDTALGLFKEEEVDASFKKVIRKASRIVRKKFPDAFGGNVLSFLQDKLIIEELIKILFIDHEIDYDELGKYIDYSTLPPDFPEFLIEIIKNELKTDKKLNHIFSNKLIYHKVISSDHKLEALIKNNETSLRNILEIREILEKKFIKKFSYNDFINIYYKNAKLIVNDVNFFGLGIEQNYKKPRIRIDKIFVGPKFRYRNQDQDNDLYVRTKCLLLEEREGYYSGITIKDLLTLEKNCVILGDPGAGKSLFVKAIIYAVVNNDAALIDAEHVLKYLPIRIELRKYLAYKRKNSTGIMEYVLHLFSSDYGIIQLDIDDIKIIIKEENILMLFDGLDEIFNVLEKNEIKNDIIFFTDAYSIRSIVTSRYKGYEDAKFNKDYLEFEMMKFDENQISEYIYRWYDFEEENISIRNQEIKDFHKAKNSISIELLENPLLLSLIVILYRNNLRLPESKLEIYQSCTKTLVDKWDSIKELDIAVNKDILSRKETILADLAFWQYEKLSDFPDQISYSSAFEAVSNSIALRFGNDDWSYTKNIAEPFMEYLEKRSIYFDNNFTHKTFLEYYAAYWIYSNCDKKHLVQKRDEILDKYISSSFWYIVFELLLNMIDHSQSDEEIIDGIYSHQMSRGESTYEFLLSALPSMQRISNRQIQKLFEGIIKYLSDKLIITPMYGKRVDSNRSQVGHIEAGIFDYFTEVAQMEKFRKPLIQAFLKTYEFECDFNKKNSIVSTVYQVMKDVYNENAFLKGMDLNNLTEVMELQPFTHLVNLYAKNNLSGEFNELLVDVLSFVKRHGVEACFVRFSPEYDKWAFVSVFDYFTQRMTKSCDFNNMGIILDMFEGVGINKDMFIERMSFSDYYFGEISIIRLSDMIFGLLNAEQKQVKLVFAMLFVSSCRHNNNLDAYRNHDSKDLPNNDDINKILSNIDSINLVNAIKSAIGIQNVERSTIEKIRGYINLI